MNVSPCTRLEKLGDIEWIRHPAIWCVDRILPYECNSSAGCDEWFKEEDDANFDSVRVGNKIRNTCNLVPQNGWVVEFRESEWIGVCPRSSKPNAVVPNFEIKTGRTPLEVIFPFFFSSESLNEIGISYCTRDFNSEGNFGVWRSDVNRSTKERTDVGGGGCDRKFVRNHRHAIEISR